MNILRNLIFVYITSNLIKIDKNLSFNDLNFRKIDFTNYKQIKLFIFKKNFYKQNLKSVQNFEFLNFSKNLGGKIGINLSKLSILQWHKINKKKLNHPWSEDLASKRLINILYNYEFINSSSTLEETKSLNKVIYYHMYKILLNFKYKIDNEITSYDLIAYTLSLFVLKKYESDKINY